MMGMPVALEEVGELKRVDNRTAITHLNSNEYVMIFGQITDSNTGNVTAKADEVIDQLDLPKSVAIARKGPQQLCRKASQI